MPTASEHLNAARWIEEYPWLHVTALPESSITSTEIHARRERDTAQSIAQV